MSNDKLREAREKLERYLETIVPVLHRNDFKPELDAVIAAALAATSAAPPEPTEAIDAVAVDTGVYDELLDFTAGVDTSLTLRQHFRLAAAALAAAHKEG